MDKTGNSLDSMHAFAIRYSEGSEREIPELDDLPQADVSDLVRTYQEMRNSAEDADN